MSDSQKSDRQPKSNSHLCACPNENNHPPSVIKEGGLTYEDYAKLPGDGPRYELIDGKLTLLAPAPLTIHQMVSQNLQWWMMQRCRLDYFILQAPIDLILTEKEVYQPDLVMIHRQRTDILTKRGIERPPDLIVEILSPSTALRDKREKRATYARFGIKEYWIVDPVHRIVEQFLLDEKADQYRLYQVYGVTQADTAIEKTAMEATNEASQQAGKKARKGDENIITSPLIPCLQIPVSEVFRDLELIK